MKSKAFIPFYFAILSLAEGSGSQCKGIEEEKCSAFIKFFDPQPNILKTVKDSLSLTIMSPFQKTDPKALFDQGLTCLQYDSYASPAEAYNLSDPVVLNIENEIMSMDEMNDMKKEISLTRKSSTLWSDPRLKWPDECWDQEAYLLDLDLNKIWTPTFMHTGMKYQLEKSDDAQAKSFWEPVSNLYFYFSFLIDQVPRKLEPYIWSKFSMRSMHVKHIWIGILLTMSSVKSSNL